MENILEKARELGQLIAASEEYKNLNQEENKASANPELSDLFAQYADLRDQIAEKELSDDTDEAELDAMEDQADALQSQISHHASMVDANIARLNFNRMMDRVNRALQAQITGEDEFAQEEGCGSSGGCAGCSGCGPER